MKEFMTKHPILSFLLATSAIDGVVKVVKTVCYAITGREALAPSYVKFNIDKDADKETKVTIEATEEETTDESSGDIQ